MLDAVRGYINEGHIAAVFNGILEQVPDDPHNSYRQMIAEWEAAGNVIPSYEPPPASIPPLPRLAFWLAAAEIGVTKAGIRAHIDAMPEGVEKFQALAYLEEAQVYRREDPLLIQMAAVEGITEPELDALWIWTVQSAVPVSQQPA
jgi:hypothetical protein